MAKVAVENQIEAQFQAISRNWLVSRSIRFVSPVYHRDGATMPERSWATTDHIIQVSIEESDNTL
jgi:hypothetical protein